MKLVYVKRIKMAEGKKNGRGIDNVFSKRVCLANGICLIQPTLKQFLAYVE